MKLEVRIGGRSRSVEFERRGSGLAWRLDGRAVEVDALEVSAGVYSILLSGRAFEVQVEPRGGRLAVRVAGRELSAEVVDPRRLPRRGGTVELEGRQEILAPMPGKVVRLLAKQGDSVESGQGILVVEAMKMQNEVRAPKSGTLERLLVGEGQAVNAGEALAVVV